MRTEQEIKERLREIEEGVLIRIREGHPQVKLIDSGRIEMLNWVLEENNQSQQKYAPENSDAMREGNSSRSETVGVGLQNDKTVNASEEQTADTHSTKQELNKEILEDYDLCECIGTKNSFDISNGNRCMLCGKKVFAKSVYCEPDGGKANK